MKNRLLAVAGVVCFSLAVLFVGLGAQAKVQPHPIFSGLEVGQRVTIQWDQGGWTINNLGARAQIVAIGSDYIVVRDVATAVSIPIYQIRQVAIR